IDGIIRFALKFGAFLTIKIFNRIRRNDVTNDGAHRWTHKILFVALSILEVNLICQERVNGIKYGYVDIDELTIFSPHLYGVVSALSAFIRGLRHRIVDDLSRIYDRLIDDRNNNMNTRPQRNRPQIIGSG